MLEKYRPTMDDEVLRSWAVDAQARIDRLEQWIAGECRCPCCEQEIVCLPSCTFENDAPSEFERMCEVREVMLGA